MFLLSVYYVKYGKTVAFIVKVYPSVQEFDNMHNVQVIAHFIPHGPLTGKEEFVLYCIGKHKFSMKSHILKL